MKARRLRTAIVSGAVFVVAAIVGSTAFDGWRLHQQIMAANERELGNLAEALTTGTLRSVLAVDVLLRDTAAWYESSGRRLAAHDVDEALATRVVGVSQVSVLTVVDATGRQRYRSRTTGEPLADVSDRPYFMRQRDRPDAGLVINEPIVTRTSRAPALVLSRPLRDAAGSFDGVISAIVTLQELQSTYAAIQPGRGSALLLTLSDGTLVVRQPPLESAPANVKFSDLMAFRGGRLVDRAVSPIDGRRKLIAVLQVGDRPLTLAVTRDEREALQPWYDEMQSAAIRTLLLVALVIVATFSLLRQLRRLERSALALQQSEQRYAMAMEAANEGHAEWDIGRATAFVSARWCSLHGLADERQTLPQSALLAAVQVHPDDLAPARSILDDHLQGRTPAIDLEYRVRQLHGAWRWIHARGRCVFDGAGHPQRLFCAAHDITDRKASEVANRVLEDRLQQTRRMEALGTLAGGIAHDFNNILGAILGFGDMAQQLAPEGTPMRRHIDRVLQAGGRAKGLVRRVLEFSRSGVAEQVPVDFQAVVDEALAMLAPALTAGVSMTPDLSAEGVLVRGDATQLHQVVMNLCTNALQAVEGDGTVEVGLHVTQVMAPTSTMHGELAPGTYVRLVVADDGPGIDAAVLGRIFEPFFTTKKPGQGTGLGLSVVHGIVAKIGGAIDVASGPGTGTRITAWLPVVSESTSLLAPNDDDFPRGDGQVVMIVDDERPLLELGEELLASLGYAPLAFESASAALKAFHDDPSNVDAVLTDETMPGMSGSELVSLILRRRPDLPVIMMSGHILPGLEERARHAGVGILLHKPLSARELADSLARCLGTALR